MYNERYVGATRLASNVYTNAPPSRTRQSAVLIIINYSKSSTVLNMQVYYSR